MDSALQLPNEKWKTILNDRLDSENAYFDISSQFLDAFQFHDIYSYETLKATFLEFSSATGSVYIKYSSELFGPGDPQRSVCRYKKLRYVCIHYGTRQSAPSLRKNQHTTKIGCSSCFSVKCVHDRLHIVSSDMRHCHPVDPASALMYPKNRRLNPREVAEIEHLLDFSFDMEELKNHIKGD
ncbi:unnamed protein product [Schistocephalus solidus]|uniref:FAR1 DNA-binding domain n=1 Tax=Schistocephalus solidus TaxID=70667 RepID=A0A183TIZ4_SCHSO|nr:unnamed protein product [Schistocephalus solidus]